MDDESFSNLETQSVSDSEIQETDEDMPTNEPVESFDDESGQIEGENSDELVIQDSDDPFIETDTQNISESNSDNKEILDRLSSIESRLSNLENNISELNINSDSDSDGDGIPDSVEGTGDSDEDGTPDLVNEIQGSDEDEKLDTVQGSQLVR